MGVSLFNRADRTRRTRPAWRLAGCVLLSLALCACAPGAPTPAPTAGSTAPTADAAPTAGATQPTSAPSTPPAGAEQPLRVTGTFTYSNDIITAYYVEHMAALIDMYAFVTRDEDWEIPVESQVLGYMDLDAEERRGTYSILLPAQPAGQLVDVDNDGETDTGVQVFVTSYWPNLSGDPFSVGFDVSRGWPSYLASTVNDSENDDEVIGGRLVVWAPDDAQQFPTDFGDDGRLFTEDDPAGPLPAGYSVIDLDQRPFAAVREEAPELALYEPLDAAVKDYSELSYNEAFQQLFERVRTEYAFNGIEGKEPDWDALYSDLAPRVAEAQQASDGAAFYAALRDFAFAFRDGHVGLSGGTFAQEEFQREASHGYGLAVRELDDGRVIATFVTEGGPAATAGVTVGAEISSFRDQPIADAIAAVRPLSGPFSTEAALRYQQQRFLTRAREGESATISFTNPGGQPQTATLTAAAETQSFQITSLFRGFDPNALPVEYEVLDAGLGYVRINSNYDDLNLIVRLFERALQTTEQNQLPGLIIDMRRNTGGAPLQLAAFLTDEEIPMGQLQYYSEETGQFEPEGNPDVIRPADRQYRFDKLALLVDQACYSACELESYGFSQVPGAIVVGQYPSAGVEAEVARGQFLLPEGLSFQVPTGRFVLPDGSIFLEGVGVEPTQRVPINEQTVLAGEDVVLQTAIEALAD